ncbi:hypothetical protein E1B28_005517 [Marasmius oreades]|uniref:Uncharacterized protein n=1 Tax=Marasmius oreades TaxID=181124 RepID=A0A9P7UUM7_9AGAR|nr:uncharacterized protein E1B28_005517 [Marasmius oreades]KAG7094698.1 hypothetical protein E1B28_005517 [Marasmius oreades]
MESLASTSTQVSNPNPLKTESRPSHWVGEEGTAFQNPGRAVGLSQSELLGCRAHDRRDQL